MNVKMNVIWERALSKCLWSNPVLCQSGQDSCMQNRCDGVDEFEDISKNRIEQNKIVLGCCATDNRCTTIDQTQRQSCSVRVWHCPQSQLFKSEDMIQVLWVIRCLSSQTHISQAWKADCPHHWWLNQLRKSHPNAQSCHRHQQMQCLPDWCLTGSTEMTNKNRFFPIHF